MPGLVLISDSAGEPVSLAEAKAHMRVDASDQDAVISSLITVARQAAENKTAMRIGQQTYDYYLDSFPSMIRLPVGPVSSVISVKYVDDAGILQTLDASVYQSALNRDTGLVVPAYGEVWPSTRDQPEAVVVRFVAGWDASSSPSEVPLAVRHAILMIVAHLFENREAVGDAKLVEVPVGVMNLLMPYVRPG